MVSFLIKLYWKIFPENKRRVCLYKEICSKYVYRINKEKGFIHTIKSSLFRFKNCNNKYNFIFLDNKLMIKTREGNIIKQEEINPVILNSYYRTNNQQRLK